MESQEDSDFNEEITINSYNQYFPLRTDHYSVETDSDDIEGVYERKQRRDKFPQDIINHSPYIQTNLDELYSIMTDMQKYYEDIDAPEEKVDPFTNPLNLLFFYTLMRSYTIEQINHYMKHYFDNISETSTDQSLRKIKAFYYRYTEPYLKSLEQNISILKNNTIPELYYKLKEGNLEKDTSINKSLNEEVKVNDVNKKILKRIIARLLSQYKLLCCQGDDELIELIKDEMKELKFWKPRGLDYC